jgi:hypothetical protein
MGRLLRSMELQHFKTCDKDPPHYGCNRMAPVMRTLHNVPAVLTLQLAWEMDVSGEDLGAALGLLDTVLDPNVRPSGGSNGQGGCAGLS